MNSVEQKQLQINNKNYNANVLLAEVSKGANKYSQLDLSHSHFTSFDSGYAVPVLWEEVLPGDIFQINVSGIIRMSSPASNTMANPIMSINAFYVSNMSLWPQWKNLMGESQVAGPQVEITSTPILDFSNNTVDLKYKESDLAAFMGFPLNTTLPKTDTYQNTQKVCALMFGAYIHICNNFYIDQNFDSHINGSFLEKDNFNVKFEQYKTSMDYHESLRFGFGLCPTSKLPDYFTTCLSEQQKGDMVAINSIPLKSLFVTNTKHPEQLNLFSPHWYTNTGAVPPDRSVTATTGSGGTNFKGYSGGDDRGVANLSLAIEAKSDAPIYNIQDLRSAITIQHFLELDQRFGTRYNEYLKAHWGIEIDPLDIGKPVEFGGWEESLRLSQVVQTSSSTESSPMGSITGVLQNEFSTGKTWSYAATQHGYIFIIATVRTPIYYSQGLSAKWTRTDKFDYFDNEFNNVSEMPVYNQEIYYDNSDGLNKNGFGYNEPWASYRYSKNIASGYLSANSDLSLSNLYLYQENYKGNRPKLDINWMVYDPAIIKNTLIKYDKSNLEFYHQFIANFDFNVKVDRQIALYGTPGVDKI